MSGNYSCLMLSLRNFMSHNNFRKCHICLVTIFSDHVDEAYISRLQEKAVLHCYLKFRVEGHRAKSVPAGSRSS